MMLLWLDDEDANVSMSQRSAKFVKSFKSVDSSPESRNSICGKGVGSE